jgi:hypothetical protein
MADNLNAGSELDHELPDAPEAGADLAEDDTQLVAMEAALVDILGLADEIRSTGGMSRGFAMEAERIMPNTLSASIAYFSESPTATRYQISLEEIDKGVWALIIAGVTVVVGAIYKIWKWLSGDKDGDGTGTTAVSNTERRIEEVTAAGDSTVELSDSMAEAGREIRAHPIQFQGKDGTVRWNSMDQLIDSVFVNGDRYGEEKKFFLEPKPIHRDIVEQGPYTKMVHQLAKAHVFNRAAELILAKIKLLEEIEHRDRNAQGTIIAGLQKQMDDIAKPIMLKFEGKEMTLGQLAGRLREAREAAEATKNTHRLHYDEMFTKLSQSYKNKDLVELLKQMLGYLPVLDEMRQGLERTEHFVGDLTQDGQPGGNSPQVAQRIRVLIGAMHEQLTGFASLANEIDHYVHHFKSLSKTTTGFGKEIVRKVSSHMRLAEVEEIPVEWKKVVAGIEAALDAMEKSHFPSGIQGRTIRGLMS